MSRQLFSRQETAGWSSFVSPSLRTGLDATWRSFQRPAMTCKFPWRLRATLTAQIEIAVQQEIGRWPSRVGGRAEMHGASLLQRKSQGNVALLLPFFPF